MYPCSIEKGRESKSEIVFKKSNMLFDFLYKVLTMYSKLLEFPQDYGKQKLNGSFKGK